LNYPKLSDCSPQNIFATIKKLGGFSFADGSKHYKITHTKTNRAFTIPRKKRIKRGLMWDFVRSYLQALNYSEKKIFKYLRC